MALRGILLIAFFVGSLPVCLVRPFYGIVLWTVVAFMNPQAYTWSANAFPWAMAVAIPTLIGFLFFCRGWEQRLRSGKLALIAVLWAWFTVSSVISTHTPLFYHHAAQTWLRWEFVSKVLLMTLVTVLIVDSLERFRTLLIVIAGCFGVYVAKSLPFLILSGGKFRLYGPPNSMIADNNDFGLALNMTLPLFFGLYQTETSPLRKRIFGALFLLTIPAIFFTYSRGAVLGLVAVLFLMFLGMKRRFALIPVIILAAFIALAFAPQSWKDRMNPKQGLDASADERLNAWAFARNLAADYPIAGGGFETFTPQLFARYAPVGADIRGPHSVYFGVLAEHGAVGLFLYLTLVLACLWTTHRLVRTARWFDDHLVYTYAIALRFSLVGFLVSGAFLGRAYFDYYFSLVACLIILDRCARERWSKIADQQESDDIDVPGIASGAMVEG